MVANATTTTTTATTIRGPSGSLTTTTKSYKKIDILTIFGLFIPHRRFLLS